MPEPGEIIWTPPRSRRDGSNLARFATMAGFDPIDYAGLHRWSVNEPEAYHRALWDFLGIVGERGDVAVAPGADIRDTRFFPKARLNYTENLLAGPHDRIAIIAYREDGTRRAVEVHELRTLVSRIVQALEAENVQPGDRIGAVVTNDVEAIALYLASAALGAVWASCSPDFGPAGAADRLNQIDPVVIFATPEYSYAGRRHGTLPTIEAVAATPSVRRVVTIGGKLAPDSLSGLHTTLEDWLAPYSGSDIAYHRLPFDAPMVILFSSGTTGKPKCIVHTAGGLLLQHMKEQQLHCDLRPGDRLFYYTTCGWMMWNWQVTGLASRATLVTFDGSPAHPGRDVLFDLADAEAITVFGTSAKYIDACAKAGLEPRRTHRLADLRTVLSTGSPLLPDGFDHVYASWKPDVHLASISGGTDICGCFLGGIPTLPVRRGELQGAMLGMDVAVLDETGAEMVGTPGELVCRNAHVSMPRGFWNDTDGTRYHAAYFGGVPGVWTHGDYAEKRESGGFVIHGRSDTTLNPGGVRIGTAEIYRQLESVPEIVDAVCVGQSWQGDERIVLFVQLREGTELTEELQSDIRARIRTRATPRHVPHRIIAVPDIPRTRSGKTSEAAVREVIHGRPLKNATALANPGSLDFFTRLDLTR